MIHEAWERAVRLQSLNIESEPRRSGCGRLSSDVSSEAGLAAKLSSSVVGEVMNKAFLNECDF